MDFQKNITEFYLQKEMTADFYFQRVNENLLYPKNCSILKTKVPLK